MDSLEQAGWTAPPCPGATEPDYTCVGAREGMCPLLGTCDVVVLDMSLDSEAMMMRTAVEELLDLYLSSSRSVVVPGSYLVDEEPRQLARLHGHPQRDE